MSTAAVDLPVDTTAVSRTELGTWAGREVYHYLPGWGLPSAPDREAIIELMTANEKQGSTAPSSEHAASAQPRHPA